MARAKRAASGRFEVHEHVFIRGPRAAVSGPQSHLIHSHAGGSARHEHPDTGPASYTIDKAEWARATGLQGGGRKRFTPKPHGAQLPLVPCPGDGTFEVIFVGDGGKAVARGGTGGGVPAALRIMQQFRLRPVVRRG